MSDVAAPTGASPAPSAPSAAPSATPSAAPTPAASSAPSAPAAKAAPSAAPGGSTNLPHQGGSAPTQQAGSVKGNDHPEAQPGETKAETIQRVKLEGLNVRGNKMDREFTMDELKLHVQKGLGADEKFQEAANVRKAFQSFVEAVKQDPFKAFEDPAFGDLGKNFKQMVIDRLAQDFEREDFEKANPTEAKLKQYEQRLAEFEARERAAQEAQQRAAQEEADRRMYEETTKSWLSALEKAGLGGNKAFLREMALVGQDFYAQGLDLNPELMIAELRSRLADQQRVFLGGAKGEALVNLLGKDVVNEILRHHVEIAQKGRPVSEPIKAADPAPTSKQTRELEDPSDAILGFAQFLR